MNALHTLFEPIRRESRYNEIDVMKGVGILLMVMGHAGIPIEKTFALFNMPFFFAASGYLWKKKYADSIENVWMYTVRKFKKLMLPLIVTNALFTILNNMFIRIGFLSDNPEFLSIAGYDAKLFYLTGMNETISSIIKCVFTIGGTQLAGAGWFLRCLFVVNVVHCFISWIIRKSRIIHIKTFFSIVFLVSLICAWLCDLGYGQFLKGFRAEFAAYAAFLMGYGLKYVKGYDRLCTTSIAKIAIVIVSTMVLNILVMYGSVAINIAHITNPLFFILTTTIGWLLLYSISLLLIEYKLDKALIELQKASMHIILLHFLAFKLVSFMYLKISRKPLLLLASFPVIRQCPTWMWINYSIVGVLIPYIFYRFWSKIKHKVACKIH